MPVTLTPFDETPVLPNVGQLPGAEAVPPEEVPDGPSAGETLAAAFRLENTIASGLSALSEGARQDDALDPDFDFVEAIPERHQLQAEHYAFVNSQAQADAVTRKIDQEIQDRQTIEEAGTFGVVSMFAAAMIDPVNLIPVGGTAYKTYRVGASILKSATTTAKAGLLSSTAAEAVLQNTQTQRTLGEGAVNITAGTFLSGVLGGAFGAFRTLGKQGRLGRAEAFAEEVSAGSDPGRRSGASDHSVKVKRTDADTTKSVDDDLIVPGPDEVDPIIPGQIRMTPEELAADVGEGGSVGAAATRFTNIADEKIKSALGVEKVVRFQDPLLRTATSASIKTRQTSQRLAEQVLTYDKNALGIETPLAVETRIAQHNTGLFKAVQSLDNEFVKYRKGREKKLLDIPKIGISDIGGAASRAEKLTYHDFKLEVGKAMRNSDSHPIPEVASAAKKFRSDVFDPLKDDAIELGLLPDDVEVETAPSYLMRVYNVEKIIAERPEFQRRVSRWLREQRDIQEELAPRLQAQLDEALAELPVAKKAVDDLIKGESAAVKKEVGAVFKEVQERIETLKKEQGRAAFKGGFDDDELLDVSDQIIDRILGTPDGRLPYDINPNASKGDGGRAALGGPLKGRSFLIPDAEIEDFLESDIEHLARVYTRSMSSDVELVREFDDVNLTNQMDDIRRDYSQKTAAKGLTEKDLIRLNEQKDADIRDIAAMRDRMRGTYAMPADPTSIIVRGARVVRTLNYLRLLGGMTASAFPDTMRSVMVHGISRTLGDGVVPLIKNFKATRLAAEEVRLSGTALDMILDSRTMQIADLMDDFGRHSKLERGIKAAQDKFGVVSLMAPWNAFFKQWTGMITMSRMLKGMQGIAEGRPAAKEIEKLASMGIDPEQAKRIWGFFEEHGQIDDGVHLPNTEAWSGPGAQEAVTAFRGALKKQVDIIIVTPGQDKPLWISSELGKVIGQFKSFAIASVQRTMLTGLQQRDLAALNGALLSVGTGMAVYGFKQNDAGRKVSSDPTVWVSEGLDRSGLFGWFFDVNNIIEKATRGRVGINAITGGPPMSRYASRNVVGALLGPSSGFVKDVFSVTGDISQGEWTESDTRALRRLLPYQNLIGFRRVLDKGEAGINDALGVERKRK
jgi:hypothetical protein